MLRSKFNYLPLLSGNAVTGGLSQQLVSNASMQTDVEGNKIQLRSTSYTSFHRFKQNKIK